jgi:hypothetical protein
VVPHTIPDVLPTQVPLPWVTPYTTTIPDSIIAQYKLLDLVHNGYVLVEIMKGMYGLPHTGILDYEQLIAHLAKHGYAPCRHAPCLWKHATHDVTFCLVVDALGVKYTNKADWSGSLYIGITLDWDYDANTVDISTPGYIEKVLHRFNHTPSQRKQDSSHLWVRPTMGTALN